MSTHSRAASHPKKSRPTKSRRTRPTDVARGERGAPSTGTRVAATSVRREFVLEVLPGLAPFARHEARATFGRTLRLLPSEREDELRVSGDLDFRDLERLRTVKSVSIALSTAARSPQELLNAQTWATLSRIVQRLMRARSFTSFRTSAAGNETSFMASFRREMEQHTRIPHDGDNGDLLFRLRPRPVGKAEAVARGWEILVRTTARPLSVRSWRSTNFIGAVDPTIAAAMALRVCGERTRLMLNLMSGSGTLMIEALTLFPQLRVVGIDNDGRTLAVAAKNLVAAKVEGRGALMEGDATQSAYVGGVFDAVVADLPWGERIGTRSEIAQLHQSVLIESARLVKPGGVLALLSQRPEYFVGPGMNGFVEEQRIKVFQGGYHPTLLVLQRREGKVEEKRREGAVPVI